MESTATTNVRSTPPRSKRLALFCTRGVTFGVLSYLVGYLLVAALFVVGPANVDAQLDVQLKWFGFIFYNAHFVPVVIDSLSYNYITRATNPVIPPLVYQAIPVVTLCMASVLFASRDRLDGAAENVVYSGASIAAGYAVLAVFGALVCTLPVLGVTARPDLVKATAIGAAYPVVLATTVTFAVTYFRR